MLVLLVEDHAFSSQGSEGSANAAKALSSRVLGATEIYSVHAQVGAYSLSQAACFGKPQVADL